MGRIYLKDFIGEEYRDWDGRKVLISAPTGVGKTTFILETLVPYFVMRKKMRLFERSMKVLIICNRRLLREQYWYSIIERMESYREIEETLALKTYQSLSEEVNAGKDISTLFQDYAIIVCDEAHYFYADSDFNPAGTFPVLQAIFRAGIAKTIVFLTATSQEVAPILEKALEKCVNVCRQEYTVKPEWGKLMKYLFDYAADFSRFHCHYVIDEGTLCKTIAESQKKTIFFLDDKKTARNYAERIREYGSLKGKDICLLNAENIDGKEVEDVVDHLVMAHRCLPKVLITTSVLDNGVSVEDPDVGNVVIITESRISFLQMLGRVRAGYGEGINLYFLERPAAFFKEREQRYQAKVEMAQRLDFRAINRNMFPFIRTVWKDEDTELTECLKTFLIPSTYEISYINWMTGVLCWKGQGNCLSVNEFAVRKTGDLFIQEGFFRKIATDNPRKVVEKQMSWIGKGPEELCVVGSSYKEEVILKFREACLKIRDMGLSDFAEEKKKIVTEFRTDLFPDLADRNRSVETKKFAEIVARYGMFLQERERDGKKRYSVQMAPSDMSKEEMK